MWAVLRALAPGIRTGLVQVFGIDPKGGMELGRASGLFQKLVYTNGAEAVELLEHVATLTRQRAEALRGQGTRNWSPASGQPFVHGDPNARRGTDRAAAHQIEGGYAHDHSAA